MKYLLFFIFINLNPLLVADEISDRNKIADNIKSLFLNSQYSQLNSISKDYLVNKRRTNSGLYKLILFDSGIERAVLTNTKDCKAIALAWIKAYPDSQSAHLGYVKVLLSEAWINQRIAMLELTSAVNRLENFHKYMNEAYIYLKKHKEILDTHPMWYRLMLDISKGQKWDKKRFFSLLDEAILKYPYFEPIYYGALFHMHPKSASFSHAEIEIVAQKALKATKDKMNNSMYAKFYWVASQAIYKEKLFLDSNVKWEIMRKGIDDVLKDFPSQRNINYFAYYSCLAKDKNKTKELLSMIIKEPSKYPWIKNDNFYTKCVNWSK